MFQRTMISSACLPALLLAFVALPAHAYIGPGAGAGTIAVVLGVLASVVLAFFAILWYPVKRMLRKKKKPEAAADAPTSPPAAPDASANEAADDK